MVNILFPPKAYGYFVYYHGSLIHSQYKHGIGILGTISIPYIYTYKCEVHTHVFTN